MRKKWWLILIIILVMVCIIGAVIFIPKKKQNQEKSENLKIVTSFYPIYIMTINLTQGAQNVEVMSLAQNNVGCLHDYTLATTDMKKMENANIFIENGLGLENFTDKIVQAYPDLKVIDSSQEVMNKIEEDGNVNPHIWTSIENYRKQIEYVSQKLCEYNPENTEVYTQNCNQYLEELKDLKLQYDIQMQRLDGKKVLCLNEALTYMARDLHMTVYSVQTNHEESTLSAEMLKNIIETMKQENIQAIFVATEDDSKNAQTLAQETGAKIYKLESGLIGELNKTSYIDSMTGNLEILKQIN